MPGTERGIIVQERDRQLLAELAVMRVVDREQARITGGFHSVTRINTRLLTLYRAGLLRRFFLGANAGNKKALYALSTKGAALLGVPHRGPRRPNDALLVADFFVLHQLAINDVYVALKRAAADSGAVMRWRAFQEPVTNGLRLIPDGYFELKTTDCTIAAFVEVDLGHERLAVWKGKISNYIQLAVSGEYERMFAQKQFRVLVVLNSGRRLRSVRKAVKAFTQKIFWFTTVDAIHTAGPLAAMWVRPQGDETHTLLETNVSTP